MHCARRWPVVDVCAALQGTLQTGWLACVLTCIVPHMFTRLHARLLTWYRHAGVPGHWRGLPSAGLHRNVVLSKPLEQSKLRHTSLHMTAHTHLYGCGMPMHLSVNMPKHTSRCMLKHMSKHMSGNLRLAMLILVGLARLRVAAHEEVFAIGDTVSVKLLA